MAIKIDLLPAYVKLRRDLHRSIAASIVVSGLVLGGLLMVLHQRQLELQTAQTNLTAIQTVAAQTATANSNRDASNTLAAPKVSVVSFMAAASKTGPQRAALLNLVRRAIFEDAIVSSIDISDGQQVLIKATVRNTNQYARFLQNLRRAADVNGGTLFKGLPTASGVGGFANGAPPPFQLPVANGESSIPIIYPLSITAQGALLNPIQLPPDPVGASTAGAPGGAPQGGPNSPPPGVPTGPPPGAVPPGAGRPPQ